MWSGADDSPYFEKSLHRSPGFYTGIDEIGYLNLVLKCNSSPAMRNYIPRVVNRVGGRIVDPQKFKSFLSLYAEGTAPKTFKGLVDELFGRGVAVPKAIHPHAPFANLPVARPSDRQKHVQILGLFDTGTNLLRELLQANFGDQVVLYENFQPAARYWLMKDEDVCYSDEQNGRQICSVWKHANLDVVKRRAPKRIRQYEADNVIAIAMVREPLAWLQGVKKQPYDFSMEGNNFSRDDWLAQPVSVQTDWYGGPPTEGYSSIIEAWNSHARIYGNLANYGFKRHLVMRYEDLVLRTQKAVDAIASLLELPIPKGIDQVMDSAKLGDSHGHDMAVQMIRNRTYEHMLSDADKSDACNRLDLDAMRRKGYHRC